MLKTVLSTFSTDEEGHPEVQTYKYDWGTIDEVDNFGITARLQADAAVGIELPLFSVYTDRHNIGFNPQIYMEFASHNYMSYHLGPVNFLFNIDVTAFRFTPFDLQFLVSMQSPEYDDHMVDFCYGMQYLTDVMDVEITMQIDVKECSYGIFGMLIGDVTDCYWRSYDIEQPIASVHFLNSLDSRSYFFPWWCSYDLTTSTGVSI